MDDRTIESNFLAPELTRAIDDLPLTASAATFARLVPGVVSGGVIRQAHRLKLLEIAERRGIRRFDANLIMAMVLQRIESLKRPAEQIASIMTVSGDAPRSATRLPTMQLCLAVALGVQALIIVGALILFR